MSQTLSPSEQFIINENRQLDITNSPQWVQRFFRSFPALQSRNYLWYFLGQLISLTGTWLQSVAQGWLVLELTHSAFWVGTVAALGTLPVLLFVLFGGVIVDRFNKKHIIFFTQTAAMLLAFILGILTLFHLITVFEIAVLAFLLGMVFALDLPARQAYVVEMVGKEKLASAIALNSGLFSATRVVGPGIAGISISLIGNAGTFIANGISYIAVIIALFFIHTSAHIAKEHVHPIKAITEGLRYAFTHEKIRLLLLFTGIASIFGWSYLTIMPVIVKNVFHQEAAALGYLLAVSGLGSLVGSIVISVYAKKIPSQVFIFGGNTIFALSLLLFSFTSNIFIASGMLFLSGAGLIVQFATINTEIQHMVSDNIRGRVMSIYTFMFLGIAPIGNFQIGFLSEHFGTSAALQFGAVVMLLFGGYVFFASRSQLKR